ncbi:putative nuclease HARBI1 [Tripterygium wilfordii]|uniref:putative nuclease HARBI1 n=1 Tax=Tripterygium wilfordii TaxID=458696 RepID=UPI0018F828E0|nr:putative nuclease HARBI1 [Tripterygium wilfordii]
MDMYADETDHFILEELAAITGVAIIAASEVMSHIPRIPCWRSCYTGHMYMTDLLRGNRIKCLSVLRMDRSVFRDLCRQLSTSYGLQASRELSVKEIVGMFVYTVGNGVGNRSVQDRFQHSGETVHRQFHNVLASLIRMSDDIIRPRDPTYSTVPKYIEDNEIYFPYFRDCIGAIDGTHIHASVPNDDRTRFIGRKGVTTQNVMAACDFDMLFTYVCAGWEGSAHDSRIFSTVLSNGNSKFPHPPPGKYYLVDSGYPNQSGYLAPYRGQRYHLEVFRNGPDVSTPREAFNHAHSSLRSVIERTFGVLKNKWHILSTMPPYSFRTQVKIVVACAVLHNFIRLRALDDPDFTAYSDDDHTLHVSGMEASTSQVGASTSEHQPFIGEELEMAALRDMIAAEMFASY